VPDEVKVKESARFAELFFCVFMVVQLSLVALLTPAYVAGAIADEKDRKTLEFMLATDLLNHEIVLSKLLSRLANLTLFLLTGLPILSVLQFIGGVDADLMLAGFAGTGLTMLGIASVSILFSTLFPKPRDAIGMSYLVIIAYMSIGTVSFALEMSSAWPMYEPIWFGEDAPTLSDASWVFNAGNPIAATFEVGLAINGFSRSQMPSSLAAELPAILSRYTWFHVPLSIVCVGWSIVRLRAIALKQTSAGKTQQGSWWHSGRPTVGQAPMIWKEVHIESRIKGGWLVWIVAGLLMLLTIGSGVAVVGAYFWEISEGHDLPLRELFQAMNIWFRIAGTGVACLMLLMVGVRASTAITSERERDTFDALITTPISAEMILASKLLGSLLSLRFAWIWFGVMLTMAIFTGGIHLLAVPIVITAWLVYAVFFAMIGLWFSMTCQSSMRATVLTVLTTLFVGGGHWAVWLICCLPFMLVARFDHPGHFLEYLMHFQIGMTPPAVIGICSYSWQDLQREFALNEVKRLFIFSLLGMFLWAVGCVILWFGILVPKFRELTRREELVYE
jgi:ABC-type transport system involved in multi-copper enzyme maturation permease subunit